MIRITNLGATLLVASTITAPASAVPTAAAGYSLTTFAGPLAGSSAPDSIAVVGGNVFVGYGNGGDPTGAGGAMSTIAEYSKYGALLGTVTVAGHNDGLRYDTASGKLWSIQNEDAAPTLVLIDPKKLAATTPIGFRAQHTAAATTMSPSVRAEHSSVPRLRRATPTLPQRSSALHAAPAV